MAARGHVQSISKHAASRLGLICLVNKLAANHVPAAAAAHAVAAAAKLVHNSQDCHSVRHFRVIKSVYKLCDSASSSLESGRA